MHIAETKSSRDDSNRRTSKSTNSTHEKEEVVIIPTETIVKKLLPLCRFTEGELRTLIKRYDKRRVGGLCEEEWKQFCEDNAKHLTSVGERLLDFDRSGEYTILIVEHGLHDSSKKTSWDMTHVTHSLVRFLESFVAGGVAGAVSKTVIAPFDRAKIIFQVDSARHFSLREVVRLWSQTVTEFGVTGLWIGNGATMLRVVPYAAITYASFDHYYGFFQHSFTLLNPNGEFNEKYAVPIRFLSGSLAGATSTTCTYPLDVMRARFAAHSASGKTRMPSYLDAFREAYAAGGVRSLYGGLFPTLVGIVPYAGCSFMCFETFKYYIALHRNLSNSKDIGVYDRLVAGAAAGLIAQSATYPLDIVRRRMQVTPHRYRGVINALLVIYKEEGIVRGWYKGLSMNWIKGPIASSTSFTVNDLIKRRSREYHTKTVQSAHRDNMVTIPEALVCGGVAAAVGKLVTVPFDKLKIMYQLGLTNREKTHQSLPSYFLRAIRHSPNMWSSSSVAMLRVIPYGALTYCLYDVFETMVERVTYSPAPTIGTRFLAGASAASLSTLATYPLDLLRTQTAARREPPTFKSYWWLMRAMAKRNGVRSLWEGAQMAVMGVGLFGGIGFATYETLKANYQCDTFTTRVAAGMAAGIVGQVFSYPLSVAKRNRQAERVIFANAERHIRSQFVRPSVYAYLYRRMPFEWTLNSLTFGISFALNDTFREMVIKTKQEMLHDVFFAPEKSSTGNK